MGGLAAAAALRKQGHRRHRLRAGAAVHAAGRGHPDRLQRHACAARAGPGIVAARRDLLSAFVEQSPLEDRRSPVRHAVRPRGRGEIRRALSSRPSRRPARGAGQHRPAGLPAPRPSADRHRAGRRRRAAPLRQRAHGRGRPADRRRRRQFDRAVNPVRRKRAALRRAHRLSHGLSRPPAGWLRHRRLHQMVGRGPPHRHVPGEARPQRSLLRDQPARAGIRPRVRGRKRAT